MKKPKSSENKAKDVETKPPLQEKRTPIPEPARAQILQRQANLNTYISGVAAALGIKENWTLDLQRLEFVERLKEK